MAKYIDADKAVEALLELYDHVGIFEKDIAAESIGVIKGVPAADVREDRRAMSPEEFAKRMSAIEEQCDDEEINHVKGDALMCEVLTELGYGDGVKIFDDMCKWYA